MNMEGESSHESSSLSSAKASGRLQQELLHMMNHPEEGIVAFPSDDSVFVWNAVMMGPAASPYENLEYRILLQFPETYPFQPPKVTFLTTCYHPNVMLRTPGDICLDILQNNWSPVLSASSVLVSIQSLLAEPNPASPLNAEAAELWERNKALYRERVLEYHRK